MLHYVGNTRTSRVSNNEKRVTGEKVEREKDRSERSDTNGKRKCK